MVGRSAIREVGNAAPSGELMLQVGVGFLELLVLRLQDVDDSSELLGQRLQVVTFGTKPGQISLLFWLSGPGPCPWAVLHGCRAS